MATPAVSDGDHSHGQARRFQRLVTRLVLRDALSELTLVVLVALIPFTWLSRIYPPPVIRRELLALPEGTRLPILLAVLVLYAAGTSPLARTAVASRRLAYLRHLPLSRARWAQVHALHLALLNAPWFAVIAYGVSAGGVTIAAGSTLLAWVGATLSLQTAAVHGGDRPALARLLVLAAVPAGLGACTLAGALRWIPLGLLGLGLTSAAALSLGRTPPERATTRAGEGSRAWRIPWPPLLAVARVELATLRRRSPRARVAVLAAQVTIAAHLAIAFANGAVQSRSGLVLVALAFGCLPGAALAISARRLCDRDRWYLDSLPVPRRAEVVAPMSTALVHALPMVAFAATAATFRAEAPIASAAWVLLDGLLTAAWVATLAAWLLVHAERRGELHGGRFAPAALATAAGVLTVAFAPDLLPAPGALALLPLAAVQCIAAWRGEPLARRARRRYEASHAGDDHDV